VSDKRLNENIKPLSYGLETIQKRNTFKYNFIADADKKSHLGLISQDVEKIISEIVSTGTDANQIKAVDYIAIVPVLIKAMQEQQEIIDAYKQKTDALEARLHAIEQKLGK
jgi:hypothetical protein